MLIGELSEEGSTSWLTQLLAEFNSLHKNGRESTLLATAELEVTFSAFSGNPFHCGSYSIQLASLKSLECLLEKWALQSLLLW